MHMQQFAHHPLVIGEQTGQLERGTCLSEDIVHQDNVMVEMI